MDAVPLLWSTTLQYLTFGAVSTSNFFWAVFSSRRYETFSRSSLRAVRIAMLYWGSARAMLSISGVRMEGRSSAWIPWSRACGKQGQNCTGRVCWRWSCSDCHDYPHLRWGWYFSYLHSAVKELESDFRLPGIWSYPPRRTTGRRPGWSRALCQTPSSVHSSCKTSVYIIRCCTTAEGYAIEKVPHEPWKRLKQELQNQDDVRADQQDGRDPLSWVNFFLDCVDPVVLANKLKSLWGRRCMFFRKKWEIWFVRVSVEDETKNKPPLRECSKSSNMRKLRFE